MVESQPWVLTVQTDSVAMVVPGQEVGGVGVHPGPDVPVRPPPTISHLSSPAPGPSLLSPSCPVRRLGVDGDGGSGTIGVIVWPLRQVGNNTQSGPRPVDPSPLLSLNGVRGLSER